MKQIFKKMKNLIEFLNASVRTKMPSSETVMPHDQMHWFKTLIFTQICCNYANNIKMIKGVHLLTPRPNMLISLIDQFTIFNGWMDGQPG